ncbi:phosphoglycerate mutase [Serratia plymuthica]|nr:phosphoglycerate mutase [Serratia plymuthica]
MISDPRLRELHMGVLEERLIDSLTPQEEQWRNRWSMALPTAVSLKVNP